MPNFLLEPGFAIYAAMAVSLVVWLGIFAFLWRLDAQARELRRKLDAAPPAEAPAPRATLEKRNGHPQTPAVTNNE
jgi:CcmD family protein